MRRCSKRQVRGKAYTEEGLLKAIIEKIGPDERVYTCSAENLTAQGLIEFLKEHGKFMPMADGFTVDTSKVCDHEK